MLRSLVSDSYTVRVCASLDSRRSCPCPSKPTHTRGPGYQARALAILTEMHCSWDRSSFKISISVRVSGAVEVLMSSRTVTSRDAPSITLPSPSVSVASVVQHASIACNTQLCKFGLHPMPPPSLLTDVSVRSLLVSWPSTLCVRCAEVGSAVQRLEIWYHRGECENFLQTLGGSKP